MKHLIFILSFIIGAHSAIAENSLVKSRIIEETDSYTKIWYYNSYFKVYFESKNNATILKLKKDGYITTQLTISQSYRNRIIEVFQYELEKYPANVVKKMPYSIYMLDRIHNSFINDAVGGATGYSTNSIFISATHLHQLIRTLHHEIAHMILHQSLYYNQLKVNIENIQTTNDDMKLPIENGFASTYGMTNSTEDLADIFSDLMTNNGYVWWYSTKNKESALAFKFNIFIDYLQSNLSKNFTLDMFEELSKRENRQLY